MHYSYSEKNTPFVLSPESLDFHLAKGWYRMGSNIFTTHFLFFKERPFSAIWLRLDLKDFKFSKSQRKLLRRNATHFAPATAPRTIDEERNDLYTVYANNFDGRLSPSISDSLEDYNGKTVFNTYESTVREKESGQLAACSYFDLGANSAASILGFYHPSMQSFSLGYYTMLLEIEYCLENDIQYYYPGYVAPGYDRFDYKLRLGNCDYFDLRTESWLPYDAEELAREGPVEIQQSKLGELVGALQDKGIKALISTYPLFEAGLYDVWNDDYVPYPYFYSLGVDSAANLIVVCFDPKEREFLVLQCNQMVQTQLLFNAQYLNGLKENNCFTDLLAITSVLFKTRDSNIILKACTSLLGK